MKCYLYAIIAPAVLAAAVVAANLDGSATAQRQQKAPKVERQQQAEPETESDRALEEKACGPSDLQHSQRADKSQHPTPAPPPDKALVYVVRPTKAGSAVQTKLSVDREWKGVNRGNTYFFFTLDPGRHHFCSQAENRSVLSLTVEAGKTYYIQQKMRMGVWKARNKLEVLDEGEGTKGLRKCQLSIFEVKERK